MRYLDTEHTTPKKEKAPCNGSPTSFMMIGGKISVGDGFVNGNKLEGPKIQSDVDLEVKQF